MFVYSFRASGIKFFAVIALSVILLLSIVTVSGAESALTSGGVSGINYRDIKTNDDRVSFLLQFGIEVDADSFEESEITMQGDFDRVMLAYNEIQKSQGLDLSKYKNKKLMLYTYRVTNYGEGNDTADTVLETNNADTDASAKEEYVYANIFVFRDIIVGADVSRGGEDGFVIALTEYAK